MASEHFVRGMLDEARRMLSDLCWFEFLKRKKLQGYILACETILEEK